MGWVLKCRAIHPYENDAPSKNKSPPYMPHPGTRSPNCRIRILNKLNISSPSSYLITNASYCVCFREGVARKWGSVPGRREFSHNCCTGKRDNYFLRITPFWSNKSYSRADVFYPFFRNSWF